MWNSRAKQCKLCGQNVSRACVRVCVQMWNNVTHARAHVCGHTRAKVGSFVNLKQHTHTLNKPFPLNARIVAANPYECYPRITDSVTTPQRDDFDNFKVSLETTSIKIRTHALNRCSSVYVYVCGGVHNMCLSLCIFVQDVTALKYEPIVFNPSSGTGRGTDMPGLRLKSRCYYCICLMHMHKQTHARAH